MRPVPGTRPQFTPFEQWRLNIDGLVEKPLALTLDDLQRFEPMHQLITLSCISNPVGGDLIGTTRWTGVSLARLQPNLRLQASAIHLKIRAADGFYEDVSLEAIRSDERVMLTYAWDGVPLLPEHGFPLRIYIPDLYGMKQPKWIESIEATDHWEPVDFRRGSNKRRARHLCRFPSDGMFATMSKLHHLVFGNGYI